MNMKYDACHYCSTCAELGETDPSKCEHTATVRDHNERFGRECSVDRDCAALYHWHSDEEFEAHLASHMKDAQAYAKEPSNLWPRISKLFVSSS